ncbi:hypothetical protein [Cardinium endosymbiont of Sogatella furcifera]|uniref:hypothetical protein n=1 Tax=Cardinium endosymbiont of Sogatella furcifera TaxID=650378 RepID=UPI000E0CCDBE|nr:hypothetical protein [Cardinium endosymbiont of Sogatella furcifera]
MDAVTHLGSLEIIPLIKTKQQQKKKKKKPLKFTSFFKNPKKKKLKKENLGVPQTPGNPQILNQVNPDDMETFTSEGIEEFYALIDCK